MEKKEVFVVMEEWYSGKRVAGVFSSEAAARTFLSRNGDDFSLCDDRRFFLDDLADGGEGDLYWCIQCGSSGTDYVYEPSEEFNKNRCECIRYYNGTLQFYVAARTRDLAVKIAHDMYSAVIANEQTMYPLLRNNNVLSNGCYPLYDFRTAEIVLEEGQKLSEEYEGRVKVRNLE